MKKKTGMLRCYANCFDCGWELDARNAMGVAAQHAKKYGHQVHVETTLLVMFNSDKGGPK